MKLSTYMTGWLILITIGFFALFFTSTPEDLSAQTLRIFTPTQGGTGIGTATAGNVGDCLTVSDDSPFTYTLGACGTGGGGGGGFPTYFQNGGATLNTATTTVNFTANSFAVVENPTDTLTIRIATTTLGLLTTNVAEGSNLYYTDARVSSYMSASTTYTDLLSFFTTPSTRITAGTGIDWSGNTLNGVYTAGDALTITGEDFDFDGGATPSGDLGGTWASPSVTDDSHAHTGTTLSGIDISGDTNLSADGTEIVLTGDALSLGTALTFTTGTSSTSFQTTLLGVGTDYISDITGTGLSITNGVLSAAGGGGGSNWIFDGTRLTPSTTVGIGVFASSTIADLNSTRSTTTNATSTNHAVTGRFSFGGVVGTAWTDFCTTITGGAGLCDGVDNASGGAGLSTSTAIANTEVIFGTSVSTVGSESAFTYNSTLNTLSTDNLTVANATSTNLAVTGVMHFFSEVWASLADFASYIASLMDTSSELATTVTDETGTAGSLVFSGNPLLTGFRSNASSTIGGGTGATGLTIYGGATTTSNAYFGGNVGIGTTTATSLVQLFSTGTTTESLDSNSSTKGACLELKDRDGSGYTYISVKNGVLYSSSVSCK